MDLTAGNARVAGFREGRNWTAQVSGQLVTSCYLPATYSSTSYGLGLGLGLTLPLVLTLTLTPR